MSNEYLEEMGDPELVCRFLAFRTLDAESLKRLADISKFVDSRRLQFAESLSYGRRTEEKAFRGTFDLPHKKLGSDAFRRYDIRKSAHSGRFLISAFEAIAIGLGFHMPGWKEVRSAKLETIVQKVWQDGDPNNCSGAGVRADTRIRKSVPLA